jgi:hypothetical protein
MTREVSPEHPEAVLGDFAGAVYEYGGTRARMTRDPAGRYLMTFSSQAAVGPRTEKTAEIVRAVGSRRIQQYLARVGTELWRLPLAYHVEERRWFHMNGAFLTADPAEEDPRSRADDRARNRDGRPVFGGMTHGFDRHVTRWNDNCVFCHNVAPNPGRDPESGGFRTTVAELGIACEACHGPGADHVRVNAASPARRRVLDESGAADPTITHPGRLSPARSADVCGRCHGQRLADDLGPFLTHGDPFVPGEDLGLYSAPLWQDTPLHGDRTAFAARFWNDGTPRLTAYEYQGLLLSACATRGTLTCTSCHGMHEGPPRGQLRPTAQGDAACTTSCHRTLAISANQARHSHHAASSPGARCVACHMPAIVFGVLDLHVSHRIERPDVARDVATGRPDACTLCHVERTRAWALEASARWWPRGPAAKPEAAVARGADATRTGGDRLAPLDALFAGDPIARAVAAEALGTAPFEAGPDAGRGAGLGLGVATAPAVTATVTALRATREAALLDAMASDRYPAVRHLAARALARLLGADQVLARKLATSFDATAPAARRAGILAALRVQLPATSSDPSEASGRGSATDLGRPRPARIVEDIEIGE